jgi:putative redox protein
MQVKPKNIITMKMSSQSETEARSVVKSRNVQSVIDEPEMRGGTNQGLMPTETLIASLLGCTNIITHRLAHRLSVHIEKMNIELNAQLDRRGAALEMEVAVPFVSVTMDIYIKTNATPAEMISIKADLGKFCPIAVIMRAAGTAIIENWHVEPI